MLSGCSNSSTQSILVFKGFIVAIHAVGKAIAAHPTSKLTEKYKHKLSLSVGTAFLVVGGLLYAFCPYLGGLAMMFIAYFLLGVAFGALGPARGYVAEQTRPDRRTYVLSRLGALEYFGAFGIAIIGALLVGLGGTVSEDMKFILPALLVSLLGAIGLYLLYYHFDDIKAEDELTEADFNPLAKQKRHRNGAKKSATAAADGDSEGSGQLGDYTPPISPRDGVLPAASWDSSEATTTTRPAGSLPPATVPPKLPSTASVESTSTVSTQEQTRVEAQRVQVLQLILLLNFVVRSVMATYATLVTEIMLSIFNTSYYSLGGMVTFAGSVSPTTTRCRMLSSLWPFPNVQVCWALYNCLALRKCGRITSRTRCCSWSASASSDSAKY
jgi:MFS family permease